MKNKRIKILFIIIFILILLIVSIIVFADKLIKKDELVNTDPQLTVSQNQVEATTPNLNRHTESEYFELQGFGTLDINKNNPYINLINPQDNDIYLSFEVTYEDKVLYSTKLIEPGLMEQFDIFNCLDAGEHTLIYLIDVYDMPNKNVLWSGIKQQQQIAITK